MIVGRRRRSVGAQRALGRSPRTPEEIDASLVGLVERVTRRMRAARRVGRTVTLRLRFGDFTRATRSHTLARATAPRIRSSRRRATCSSPLRRRSSFSGITLVGVAVSNLEDERAIQLALPFDDDGGGLDVALDEVRERFGSGAVTRAVLLGRNQGLTVPLLPD